MIVQFPVLISYKEDHSDENPWFLILNVSIVSRRSSSFFKFWALTLGLRFHDIQQLSTCYHMAEDDMLMT